MKSMLSNSSDNESTKEVLTVRSADLEVRSMSDALGQDLPEYAKSGGGIPHTAETTIVKTENDLATFPGEASTVVTASSKKFNEDSPENSKTRKESAKTTESTSLPIDNDLTPPGNNDANTVQDGNIEKDTTEEIESELSEFLYFKGAEQKKRKRNENDDQNTDVLLDVFLRLMYPLSLNMDKTITVGVFKSLDFNPAVLINHCGKTSLLLSIDMWDKFTKHSSIIEAYLYNNLTGRKTAIGFDDSDLEIDNIRLRGTQFVRFRDLSKHNKKILLTLEEFQVLSNLTPIINRYMQQLVTFGPVIFDSLNTSINTNPVVPLIYGPIDQSIYNRLPQEVSFYRRTGFFFNKTRSDLSKSKISPTKLYQENTTVEN